MFLLLPSSQVDVVAGLVRSLVTRAQVVFSQPLAPSTPLAPVPAPLLPSSSPPDTLSSEARFAKFVSRHFDVAEHSVDLTQIGSLPHLLALCDQLEAEPGVYPAGSGKLSYTSFGMSYQASQLSTTPRSVAFDTSNGVATLTEAIHSWEKDDLKITPRELGKRFGMKIRSMSFVLSRVECSGPPSTNTGPFRGYYLALPMYVAVACATLVDRLCPSVDPGSLRRILQSVEQNLCASTRPPLSLSIGRVLMDGMVRLEESLLQAADILRLANAARPPTVFVPKTNPGPEDFEKRLTKRQKKAAAAAAAATAAAGAAAANADGPPSNGAAVPPTGGARLARIVGGNPASTVLCRNATCGPTRPCFLSHAVGSPHHVVT